MAGLTITGFKSESPVVRFGVITDLHYADMEKKNNRDCRQSIQKLQDAVAVFNKEKVDFVVELGDFKDQDKNKKWKDTIGFLKEIESVFAEFNGPRYHVLGNHDMDSISKSDFLKNVINTGISKRKSYYSFDMNDIHFVVLDGCFTSEEKDYNFGDFDWDDSYITQKQLEWLKADLAKTKNPTMLFIHQRLDEFATEKVGHCVANSKEVRAVLEKSGKAVAVFQGHEHTGDYSYRNGVHFFTQKAAVEGSLPNNSFSIVEVYANGDVKINGFVNCESRTLHRK
jgi:alkaline phosphatase